MFILIFIFISIFTLIFIFKSILALISVIIFWLSCDCDCNSLPYILCYIVRNFLMSSHLIPLVMLDGRLIDWLTTKLLPTYSYLVPCVVFPGELFSILLYSILLHSTLFYSILLFLIFTFILIFIFTLSFSFLLTFISFSPQPSEL